MRLPRALFFSEADAWLEMVNVRSSYVRRVGGMPWALALLLLYYVRGSKRGLSRARVGQRTPFLVHAYRC